MDIGEQPFKQVAHLHFNFKDNVFHTEMELDDILAIDKEMEKQLLGFDCRSSRIPDPTPRNAIANINPLFPVPSGDNVKLQLAVDASKTGIGGWLYYLDDTGERKHITMGAHTFSTEAQSEWDTKSKELHAFSRYVKLYPCYDKTAETVRRCLVHLFCTMGHPAIIVSDSGIQVKGPGKIPSSPQHRTFDHTPSPSFSPRHS